MCVCNARQRLAMVGCYEVARAAFSRDTDVVQHSCFTWCIKSYKLDMWLRWEHAVVGPQRLPRNDKFFYVSYETNLY